MFKPTFKERFFVFRNPNAAPEPAVVDDGGFDLDLSGFEAAEAAKNKPVVKPKPKSKAELKAEAAAEAERVVKVNNSFQLKMNSIVNTYNKVVAKLNAMKIDGAATVDLQSNSDSGMGNFDKWQDFQTLIESAKQTTQDGTKFANIGGNPKTGYQFEVLEVVANLPPEKIEEAMGNLDGLNGAMGEFLKKIDQQNFEKAKAAAKTADDSQAAQIYDDLQNQG